MKKLFRNIICLIFGLWIFCSSVYGQGKRPNIRYYNPTYENLPLCPFNDVKTCWIKGKINAVPLAGLVANAGVEFKISPRFSIDIPFLYSPYNISSTKKIRVLALQPELRYWVNKRFNGHFFGLHTHVMWFNTAGIIKNKDLRYQDSGDKPLLGAGISYGYALPISEKFDIEFTLGVGYAKYSYDSFYNVPNGQKLGHNISKDYWGITRLGVTFSYKL